MPITITEKAKIEMKKIIEEQKEDKKLYIRLKVLGGGCSGFQHKLEIENTINEKIDEIFKVKDIDFVVDKRSLMYVGDSNIDYFDDDMNHLGFKITNPAAKTTCGCGSSFSM